MSRLTNAFLWWISWLVCLCQACAPALPRLGKGALAAHPPPVSPWAVRGEDKLLLKLQLEYGKKLKIGGLLIIKRLPEQQPGYRLVFLAEVGLVLADFELRSEDFIVHRQLQALRNPMFFKLIENDFRLLLLEYPPSKPWRLHGSEADERQHYSCSHRGLPLVLERGVGGWVRFAQGRRLRIDWAEDGSMARMRHYFLPLRMELRRLPASTTEAQ